MKPHLLLPLLLATLATAAEPAPRIASLQARLDPSGVLLVDGAIEGIAGGGNMTIEFGGVLKGKSITIPAARSFYKTYYLPNLPSKGTVTARVTWRGATSPVKVTNY